MKECLKCKELKDLSKFYKDKSAKDGHTRRCMACLTYERNMRKSYNLEYSRYNRAENAVAINKKKRQAWANLDPRIRMLQQARNRAKLYNFDFNLDIEDIIIPDECPLLNVKFEAGIKGNYSNTYSLDRVNNSKGYVKGNV